MTFLPIVERELRVRSRLKSTYLFRVSGALAAMLIVAFMLVLSSGVTAPDKLGKLIFEVLAWVAFIYCLLEGARNTADCLSEEKRGGTIGLLFLTDLKGYDVVLGKMMATSLNSFYALLAALPLVATPLLLGGVTAGEFWRLALVLVSSLLFSLAIGLSVSAMSRGEHTAWACSFGLILALSILPFLAPLGPWVYFSPSLAFNFLSDAGYTSHSTDYWRSILCTLAASGGLVGLASFVLPRAWQDRVVTENGLRWPKIAWLLGSNAKSRRQALLKQNPVIWLAERQTRLQWLLWAGVAAAGGAALALDLANNGSASIAKALFWSGMVLNIVLVPIGVAAQASFLFGDSRSSGALELLLATPLTVKEIVSGHFLALRNLFLGPVSVLITFEVGMVVVHIFQFSGAADRAFALLLALAVTGFFVILFVTDLYAAAWFGLWMGLRSKKAGQALVKTVLFVLILPLVCGTPWFVLWPIFGLVKDLIFINYAQEQLHRRFREMITEQFSRRDEAERWKPAETIPPFLPFGQ